MPRATVPILLVLALPLAAASASGLEVQVRDAAGAPLPEAVVHAMPSTGPAEAKGAKAAAVEQVDREFVPYVSAIQTGTAVSFPNRDPILHHVYSFSPAKSFEIKLYQGRSPRQIVFDKPGVVTLGCNIHDWMIGHILVVSTPHFAKTGADGIARLTDLPAGSYELAAWHPRQRAPAPARPLRLEAGAEARAAFAIDVAPRRAQYKPPLDRMRY